MMPREKALPKTKCEQCTGLCCRYIALEIDKPETKKDFDNIRWYIAHQRVSVFVERGRWYLQVREKCAYLTKENRCAIYENRPAICRRHDPENCEFTGKPEYKYHFKKPAEIEAFYDELKRTRRAKKKTKK